MAGIKKTITELDREFKAYAAHPSEEAEQHFIEFVKGYAKSYKDVYAATYFVNGHFGYETTTISSASWYVIFTSTNEKALWPKDSYAYVPLPSIVDRILSNPDVNGICINPYNVHRVFLTKADLKDCGRSL